jgi:hypothetical protein
VATLSGLVDQTHIAERVFVDWLRHEFGLEKIKGARVAPSTLDADSLVTAFRASLPRSRTPTAAQIAELKGERATTGMVPPPTNVGVHLTGCPAWAYEQAVPIGRPQVDCVLKHQGRITAAAVRRVPC